MSFSIILIRAWKCSIKPVCVSFPMSFGWTTRGAASVASGGSVGKAVDRAVDSAAFGATGRRRNGKVASRLADGAAQSLAGRAAGEAPVRPVLPHSCIHVK